MNALAAPGNSACWATVAAIFFHRVTTTYSFTCFTKLLSRSTLSCIFLHFLWCFTWEQNGYRRGRRKATDCRPVRKKHALCPTPRHFRGCSSSLVGALDSAGRKQIGPETRVSSWRQQSLARQEDFVSCFLILKRGSSSINLMIEPLCQWRSITGPRARGLLSGAADSIPFSELLYGSFFFLKSNLQIDYSNLVPSTKRGTRESLTNDHNIYLSSPAYDITDSQTRCHRNHDASLETCNLKNRTVTRNRHRVIAHRASPASVLTPGRIWK